MQQSLVHRLQHHLALRVLCLGHVPGVPPAPPPALTAIGQPRVCMVQKPSLASARLPRGRICPPGRHTAITRGDTPGEAWALPG